MRTNAILEVTSGAILSIAAVPALYTHILFGYASQDSAAPIWNSPWNWRHSLMVLFVYTAA
jgi:hypothetical protein